MLGCKSGPQAELCRQLDLSGHADYVTEYRFCPARKWRIDLVFIDHQLAVEVEGGVWHVGRHQRPEGFQKDCEKYNALTIAGWRLLRVTPAQIASGQALKWIETIVGERIEG